MARIGTPSFGQWLRQRREAAGLTQEELSERAALSIRGLKYLEQDARQPYPDTVRRLANALGLPPAEPLALLARMHPSRQNRQFDQVHPDHPYDLDRRSLPLVGREQEVSLLDLHLGPRATAPVLFLAGEPGIGKTRLLEVAAQRGLAAGWTVLEGGCRRGGQEPYAPVLGALQGYLRAQSADQLREDLRGCAWLVRLLPELADSPIEPLPGWTPAAEHERRLMVEATAHFLANVAGRAGTLLVLDDLHWAGSDALDLLAALIQLAGTPPLRVVGAYRETEVRPDNALSVVLSDLAHAGLAAHRTLTPLALEEAGQLFDALLNGEVDNLALRAQAVQHAGGVPFYVVSYADGLRAGALASGGPEAVPWDVAQGLRQRIAALPEAARAVLDVAAVAGYPVLPALLMAVVNRPEEEVLEALEAACRDHLLVEVDKGHRFAHDVIREVVEAGLSAARRAMFCRRLAEALEADPDLTPTGELPVELLAHFYGLAGGRDKAIEYLEQAGNRAQARFAYTAAIGHYREALSRLQPLPRGLDAARIGVKLSRPLIMTGRFDEALDMLEQAAEAYRLAGDLTKLGDVAGKIAYLHVVRGTPEEGIQRLQPLLAFLEAHDSAQALANLYLGLLWLYFVTGRYDEVLETSERAVELARAAGDVLGLGSAVSFRAAALLMLGCVAEAVRIKESAVESAWSYVDPVTDFDPFADFGNGDFLANIHMFQGDFAACRRYHQRARAMAERAGDPREIAFASLYRGGIIAFHTGDWDLARQQLERAVRLMRQAGLPFSAAFVLLGLGRLRLAEGRCAEASALLEEAHTLALRSGDLQGLRWAARQLAERDLLEGHPESAHERLLPLLDRSNAAEFDVTYLLPVLARAYLELGEVEQAADTVAQAIVRMRAENLRLMLADALWVQAMVRHRQGKPAEAAEALEEGIALAREMPYPYAEARLLHVYGLLPADKDEPGQARARLEEALSIFERLGARTDAERVEQALSNVLRDRRPRL
jgi:tetratricopeptide (TPR) repeat protein/transcriptional regulator with XRE-family HTH domain